MKTKRIQSITPVRLQRKRQKGFKLISPNGLPIVYVGRPTIFGNAYKVGDKTNSGEILTRERILKLYEKGIREVLLNPLDYPQHYKAIKSLRGKNLCCFCKPSEPCHADILLAIANPPQADKP